MKEGDVVAQFDTTEQEFRLREAQADLAEAEQQVVQVTAESEAKEEEARYELLKARSELKLAELETRRNELLSRIAARQNDLALAAATDKVKQLEKDYDDRVGAARAGIAMQEAARTKATVAAATAQRNIDSMTLKAKTSGYVAIQQNTQGNFNWGSLLACVANRGQRSRGNGSRADSRSEELGSDSADRGTRSWSSVRWATDGHRCRSPARQELQGQSNDDRRYDWTTLESTIRMQDRCERPVCGAYGPE